MLYLNNLQRTFLTTMKHFAILLSTLTRAEESSILSRATVVGNNINTSACPDPSNLINGFFKIGCTSYIGTAEAEFVIDFEETVTLNTVYLTNFYYSRSYSYLIGTLEIRLGDDSGAHNRVNSIVWPELYDGGFFPIGTM